MSNVQFNDTAKDAVKKIRDATSEVNWLLLGFDGESIENIIEVGSGSGGADELATKLEADKVLYGLVRVKEKVDESDTIKYLFINFIGENVKSMRKARTSTQIGKVQEFLTPYHTNMLVSSPAEISSVIVANKVGVTSGQKSKVREEGTQELKVKQVTASGKRSNLVPIESGANLKFADQQGLLEAIKDVRADDTPTNWVIAGFVEGGSDTLTLLGKGIGGVNELKTLLKDDEVQYGLVRLSDQIDNSVTVKFVFIHFVGEQVKYTRKARIGIHIGKVTEIFTPHHTDLTASKMDDISEEVIVKKLRNLREAKVGEGSTSPKVSPSSPKRKSLVPTAALSSVSISNESEFKDAMKALRDNNTSNDWVLVQYDAGNTTILHFVGTGSGGTAELTAHLKDDNIAYGLVRIVDQIDNSKTIKYCFVNWVGANVKGVVKARVATNIGFIANLFHPYHVDVAASSQDEISQQIISDKVRETSGSKTKVLENKN